MQGRLWPLLSRAAKQALPHAEGTAPGDASRAGGGFRGVAKCPRSLAGPCPPGRVGSGAMLPPPSQCTQTWSAGGRRELSVCILYTVTFWGGK